MGFVCIQMTNNVRSEFLCYSILSYCPICVGCMPRIAGKRMANWLIDVRYAVRVPLFNLLSQISG